MGIATHWRRGGRLFIGIPFVLSQWTPFATEFKGSPKVEVKQNTLQISTDNAAGGYAYFLKKRHDVSKEALQLQWQWNVAQFPRSTYAFPLTKKTEDFALRVGLLFTDGKERVPLPSKFRRALRKQGLALSHVLFYCATPLKTRLGCQPSPYHKNIFNCLEPASNKRTKQIADYRQDLKTLVSPERYAKMQLFGLWIFADSDNSATRSQAQVANLMLLPTPDSPAVGIVPNEP